MADEVIVIDRGRLVRQGSLADLTAGHSSLHVAAVDRDALLEVLIGDGLDLASRATATSSPAPMRPTSAGSSRPRASRSRT